MFTNRKGHKYTKPIGYGIKIQVTPSSCRAMDLHTEHRGQVWRNRDDTQYLLSGKLDEG